MAVKYMRKAIRYYKRYVDSEHPELMKCIKKLDEMKKDFDKKRNFFL